jgi:predicted dehydrogenase
MRIALLGVDDVTLAVAAAAMQSNEREVVLIDAQAARANEAAAIAPQARLFVEWEALLGGAGIEAIVLAADEPMVRVEQLRRLIQLQRGIAVLVSHPLVMSMLECYELEMIREESASVIMPYLPARLHPAMREMQDLVDKADGSVIGAIEQITFQRSMARRDREGVLRQFTRDVDVLQVLAGNTTKLHAFASDGASGRVASIAGEKGRAEYDSQKTAASSDLRNLVVQMTTGDGLVIRWTVVPTTDLTAATLTLVGSQGEANLRLTDDKRPWRLEIRSSSETQTHDYPGWDPAMTALDQLAEAHVASTDLPPTWAEAARTVELAEAIDLSLARGRTIELHEEEFSDIGTFKGVMTSVGCGLLVAVIALVIVVAMVHLLAVQAGWNQLAARLDNWPYLLLVLCGIYLLLQSLVFIGKPRHKTKVDAATEKGGGGEG